MKKTSINSAFNFHKTNLIKPTKVKISAVVLVVDVENISIQEKNYKLIIMKKDVINVQNAKINFPQASFKIVVSHLIRSQRHLVSINLKSILRTTSSTSCPPRTFGPRSKC